MRCWGDFTEEGCELNIGFIGAGRVGVSLGKYFTVCRHEPYVHEQGDQGTGGSNIGAAEMTVKGYYSLHGESAREAARFTDSQVYDTIPEILSECDMIFVTVPDGKIKAVWEELLRYDLQGKLICHCSGAMSSLEAFTGIEETGAYGYSIHPLFAVSDKYEAYRELTDVFFTLEGCVPAADDPYIEDIKGWLGSMGNPVGSIRTEDKPRYHCAATIASNLVCALADLSVELFNECGFSEQEAIKALAPILTGNMAHIAADGPTRSLTGPVERRDAETVRKHLNCLQTARDKQLYALLSTRLTDMAQRRHPERDYSGMYQLLRKDLSK